MTEIFDEIVNAVEQAKAQPKEEIQLVKYVVPNIFAKYMKQLGWTNPVPHINNVDVEHFVKGDWELWHSWDSYYGTNKITFYNKCNKSRGE